MAKLLAGSSRIVSRPSPRVGAKVVTVRASVSELDAVLIGRKLADDLGIAPGQMLTARSARAHPLLTLGGHGKS